MLFISSLMHFRVASKMELMGLETAGTLQECIAYYVMATIVLINVAYSVTNNTWASIVVKLQQPYKNNPVDVVLKAKHNTIPQCLQN